MATKKQSSAKQSKPESAVAEDDGDTLHVELIGVDMGAPGGDMSVEARVDKETGEIIEMKVIDFAALESRVAQAEQGYAAAVSSVGTTADELREARAALREARGG